MGTSSGLNSLAAEIAELVWARLQDKLESQSAKLLTAEEAAARIGVKRTKFYAMLGTGEFPATAVRRIGRKRMIISTELELWLSAH